MKVIAGAIIIHGAAIVFATGMVLIGVGIRSEAPGNMSPGGITCLVAALLGIFGAFILASGLSKEQPGNPYRKADE